MSDPPARRVRDVQVQLVLYDNDAGALLRLAGGLGAAVATARGESRVRSVRVVVGDCSAERCITDADWGELLGELARHDVTDVTFEHFGVNLGSGGGSNRLAAAAPAGIDALWILNPDTYPAPTALSWLLAALDGAGVAAVDARQLPVEHPKGFDPATGDAAWVTGACMLVDRAAFDAVGGFDPGHFPMYCDDVDLSWRLRLAGDRVVHEPAAVVFHDKRIGADGRPLASEGEHESGALSRLFLCRRYARPDVEAATVEWIEARGDPAHRRALAAFRQRDAAGDVPLPLDGADRVADLDSDYYGPARFRYG